MKILKILILINLIFSITSYAQIGRKYYIDAYNEQLAMLQDQKPVDFKRAVFITENSYYKGALNYDDFCKAISDIGIKLKEFVKQRGLEQYKTAGNIDETTMKTAISLLSSALKN